MITPDMLAELSEESIDIVTKSMLFIGSFDRNVLGKFASPDHIFLMMELVLRNSNNETYYPDLDRFTSMGLRGTTLSEQMAAEREVYFWWSQCGDDYMKDRAQNKDHNKKVDWAKFSKLSRYPDFYDYFINDIWDTDFIRQCVADGIDPSLAKAAV